MNKQLPLRQRIRKAIVILTFLSFPITMNYLSPYVIVGGAAQGIVSGSLILFGLVFVSSLFLGRMWCGWVCPGGGMQEIVEPINRRAVNGRKIDWIKWLIWIPWVSLILWLFIRAGGIQGIDFQLDTVNGISISGSSERPIQYAYIIYYGVIALMTGLAVLVGRRASCHTICWMAPFMLIGRWIRNRFGWPSMRLTAKASDCIDCQKCTANCPMSLDVNALVKMESMEQAECILCLACVDVCPKHVIHSTFSAGK